MQSVLFACCLTWLCAAIGVGGSIVIDETVAVKVVEDNGGVKNGGDVASVIQQMNSTIASLTSIVQAMNNTINSMQQGYQIPVGGIVAFAGSTAPLGYLACDGASYLTSQYPSLYNAIGGAFGTSGAGSTLAFNVPDLRSRVIAGLDGNSATTSTGRLGSVLAPYVLGATGGAETHALTVAELASHDHAATSNSQVTDSGHSHTAGTGGNFLTQTSSPQQGAVQAGGVYGITALSGPAFTGISVSVSTTISSNGNGVPHPILQPTMILNYCIKF